MKITKKKDERVKDVVLQATGNQIAGISVTNEIYDDYVNRSYKVSYGEIPYRTLELYAYSPGVAESEPDVAEECRAILEQIRAEILQLQAPTGAPTQKHPDFSGYLKDLQGVYDEYVPKRKRMVAEYQNEIAECDQKAAESTSDLQLLRAKTERAEAVEKYRSDTVTFLETVSLKVDGIRNALKDHISEFYGLDGAKIDQDTVKLLNSGIRLTDAEINGMFDQFTGNVTMLRLLSDYCQAHGIKSGAAAVFGNRALSDGSHELSVFNMAADRVLLACGNASESSEQVWGDPAFFAKIMEESYRELTDVLVKPN